MTNVTNIRERVDLEKASATIENYLLLIYILQRDAEPVVGARLAELLGVSPPTVTNTLKRMTRDGWITMEKDGTQLTETGWQAARAVMRRHMLVELWMSQLIPWSKLHEEAHNLEHALSDIMESALIKELNNPQICPHGNPMPGSEAVVSHFIPLTQAPVGQAVTVRRIHELAEENTALLAFFEAHAILPGAPAVITETLPFNQTLTLEVQGKSVVLGYSAAQYVYVETDQAQD